MKRLIGIVAIILASPAAAQQLPADVPNVCVAAPEYVGRNAGGGTSSPYVVIDAATGDTLSRHNDLGNAYESANAFTFTRDSVRVTLTHLGRCPEHLDRFLSRLGYQLVSIGTAPPDTGGTVPPDSVPTPPDTIPAPPDSTPGAESLGIVSEDSATATIRATFSGSPVVVGARGGPTTSATPVCPPFRTPANPAPSPSTSVCQRRSAAFDVYAVIEEGGAVRTVGPVTIDALPQDTTTPGPGPGPVVPPPSGWPAGILPPQANADTLRPVIQRTVRAATAADLEAAIANARPGDEILLSAGGRYSLPGGFALPARNDGGFVVIRTDISHPMVRVDTTANLADLTCTASGCSPIVASQPGDGGWRVELVTVTAPDRTNAAIRINASGTNVPRRFVFDRIHCRSATATSVLRRCVMANGASVAVLRSALTGAKEPGTDSQAFIAWNTPGPLLLYDNLLVGASENILIGGADPASAAMVPADIVIARNHVYKPPSWRGQNWNIKNLVELKIGRRVHLWGNVFENNWREAQTGYAVLLKTANQGGGFGDFSVTEHVYIERNRLVNIDMGFQLARNPPIASPAIAMHHIAIEHNSIERLGPNSDWGNGVSRTFQVQGPDDLTIRHNTSDNPGAHSYVEFEVEGGTNALVENNLFVGASGFGVWRAAIISKWTGLVFAGNVAIGGDCGVLPNGWSCPASPPAGVGADMAAVNAATAGVVR